MAKPKRGRSIKKTPGWRGVCPACSRMGVKLLWSKTVDGETLKTCKRCGQ